MIPIFLSRPNPFIEEQEIFLNKLISILYENGLKNITLVAQDYNPHESLTCLNEIIKRCFGMIIVAFGQSYIESGIIKKGAISTKNYFDSVEKPVEELWITSPFCHIEGAIGFSNGLPIIVLKQKNLKIEGILKKDMFIISAPDFSLNSRLDIEIYFQNNEFVDAFTNWKNKIDHLYDFVNGKLY